MAVIPRSWWFMTGERVFALDNRCPHMGFPLDRGSVEDGTLTCHWHHARFDLASGCNRRVLCWLAFPLASTLRSTGSAAVGTALFVGFPATMAESDFS